MAPMSRDTVAQSVRSANERLSSIEATMEGNAQTQLVLQRHAQEDRARMQRDIDELKDGHKSLHTKIDTGFTEIKEMIASDRQKSSARDGAIAFARWLVGVLAAVSSAMMTAAIYWWSRKH